MKTKTKAATVATTKSPAIAAGITKQLDALAKSTGAPRDFLANALLEHAIAEFEAGRLVIKPVIVKAGGAA